MKKQTLLILIDNLSKGGAEVMLVGILPELKKRYEVILVTLSKECDFKDEEIICDYRYILGFKSKLSFISCIFKLKKIIKKHRPSLIHSHLIYSSLAARLSCPSHTPLLYSIHGELSKSDFNNSKLLTFIEKITIRKNHSIIAVSNLAMEDYKNTIGKTKNMFILKNYVLDHFYLTPPQKKDFSHLANLKMIAVGQLKSAKNYEYLLRSLIYCKDYPVSLDIYGRTSHHSFSVLQSIIDKNNLPAVFKGGADKIEEVLPLYDIFVMSSKNEGFGIAAIEAMACGLPLLLSDLPVMREITFNNALFFNLNDPLALANLIKEVIEGKHDLNLYVQKGNKIANHYTKQKYLEKLFLIYDRITE